MTIRETSDPARPALYWVLIGFYSIGAIAVSLGAAYAWLWLMIGLVNFLGLAAGGLCSIAILYGMSRLLKLAKEPLLACYQPWDHSYWIIASNTGSLAWQDKGSIRHG